jgi:hypothetical protein
MNSQVPFFCAYCGKELYVFHQWQGEVFCDGSCASLYDARYDEEDVKPKPPKHPHPELPFDPDPRFFSESFWEDTSNDGAEWGGGTPL